MHGTCFHVYRRRQDLQPVPGDLRLHSRAVAPHMLRGRAHDQPTLP